MSYHKPIWNEVQSCHYRSSKSWGGQNDVSTTTFTGSSASNSQELIKTEISRKFYDNFVVFNAYIDGKLVKQNVNVRNGDRAGSFLYQTKSKFLNHGNQHEHKRANKALKRYLTK